MSANPIEIVIPWSVDYAIKNQDRLMSEWINKLGEIATFDWTNAPRVDGKVLTIKAKRPYKAIVDPEEAEEMEADELAEEVAKLPARSLKLGTKKKFTAGFACSLSESETRYGYGEPIWMHLSSSAV